jgi:hypothetical protein
MPPEAAPRATDPVIGFLLFWAELGEIIRTIHSRVRREPFLIINLILAELCRRVVQQQPSFELSPG